MKIKHTAQKISLYTNSEGVFFRIHLSVQKMWDEGTEYDCLLKLCYKNTNDIRYIQDLSFRFYTDGRLASCNIERAQRLSKYTGED